MTFKTVSKRFQLPPPRDLSLPLGDGGADEAAAGHVVGTLVGEVGVFAHSPKGSAEGEGVRLHTWAEELDLECAVGDAPRLPDQPMQPLLAHHTRALLVHITIIRRSYWPTI